MAIPTPTTKIENVVASVILNQRFDLVEIAATMPNVEFDLSLIHI